MEQQLSTEIDVRKNKIETLKSEVYIDGVEIVGDKNTISRGIHNYMANHPLTHEHSINWHPKYDKLRDSNE